MSGRQCGKEEFCCRKAKAMIEIHEANLASDNYNEADDPDELRLEIVDKIDEFAGWLEDRILEYVTED